MKPTKPAKPARRRRTAEEAREEILAAAERRLAAAGPDALRLQDLADDLGVSHPAVLHHFGTREDLVHAVIARAVHRLEAALLDSLRETTHPDGAAMIARVLDVLTRGGTARLMAWLMLAGREPLDTGAAQARWRAITAAAHASRPRSASREDTKFVVVLAALATFGQAVAGPGVFEMAGVDAAASARFGPWLAALLAEHLARPALPRAPARPAK
jgi:AcrR family transcriptional regulator